MPFNASGVFVRVHDWTTDLANTVPVTASRMDAEDDGFATGLSNTICRDGQSTTTARIPFASGTSAAAGSTASVAYAQTNDLDTGMYFPATDQWGLVAGGTAILTGTSAGVSVTGTFAASGAVSLSGTLGVTGNFAVNTNKFTVLGASGNTTIAGTLAVTGVTNLSAALTVSSGGAAITGNSAITGTLNVTGNTTINTDKFVVAAASGNTTVAGTLGVTGAATLSSTLAVTGAATLSSTAAVTGQLTANNSAGVVARNAAKAFAYFTTDGAGAVTIQGSFNVSGIAAQTVEASNGFRLTFTNALSSSSYTVLLVSRTTGSFATMTSFVSTRSTTNFDFCTSVSAGSPTRISLTVDIVVFENA